MMLDLIRNTMKENKIDFLLITFTKIKNTVNHQHW
jgi:hypothetical protein